MICKLIVEYINQNENILLIVGLPLIRFSQSITRQSITSTFCLLAGPFHYILIFLVCLLLILMSKSALVQKCIEYYLCFSFLTIYLMGKVGYWEVSRRVSFGLGMFLRDMIQSYSVPFFALFDLTSTQNSCSQLRISTTFN